MRVRGAYGRKQDGTELYVIRSTPSSRNEPVYPTRRVDIKDGKVIAVTPTSPPDLTAWYFVEEWKNQFEDVHLLTGTELRDLATHSDAPKLFYPPELYSINEQSV